MFNRCWRWRVLFARRSDGSITSVQWGSLQDHLASCASCRKIAEADSALQAVFNHHAPRLSSEAAAAFDDRVVAAVLAGSPRSAPRLSWLLRNWKRVQQQTRALPLAFMAQLGGGAVVAVALTSLFLLPALHSHPPVSARAAQFLENQAQDRERTETSVPMESLLQTPTPRAALLWTNPQPTHAQRRARTSNRDLPIHQNLPEPSKSEAPGKAGHSAPRNTHIFG